MTNRHPREAADAMLHEVEENLGSGQGLLEDNVVGALTAIGWALLAVEKAIRERPEPDRGIYSTR